MKSIPFFLLLTFIFSTSTFASQIFLDIKADEKQIEDFHQELHTLSKNYPEENIQVDFFGGLKNSSVYPGGDLYIFLAVGKKDSDQEMAKDEYKRLYAVMGYLSNKGFRVMINVKSKAKHLEAAIESKETSLIMWSSHGNKKYFYDYDSKAVPTDIFKNAHTNLYQFVLSACHGRVALNNNYDMPSHIKTWSWSGLTNSTEFINFLVSDDWSATEGRSK